MRMPPHETTLPPPAKRMIMASLAPGGVPGNPCVLIACAQSPQAFLAFLDLEEATEVANLMSVSTAVSAEYAEQVEALVTAKTTTQNQHFAVALRIQGMRFLWTEPLTPRHVKFLRTFFPHVDEMAKAKLWLRDYRRMDRNPHRFSPVEWFFAHLLEGTAVTQRDIFTASPNLINNRALWVKYESHCDVCYEQIKGLTSRAQCQAIYESSDHCREYRYN